MPVPYCHCRTVFHPCPVSIGNVFTAVMHFKLHTLLYSVYGYITHTLRLYFHFCYRQDAKKRQTAGIRFTHRPKIRFFRPTGVTRCTDSGQTLQDRRAPGSAWPCKISHQSVQGWECGPQNIKNFHFLVKSRPIGANPFTDFQFFRGFYTPNYPTLVFQISCDSHHRLRSYCWETARR